MAVDVFSPFPALFLRGNESTPYPLIPMKTWKKIPRVIFYLALMVGLCSGMLVPRPEESTVHAAPMKQAATNVVISEFRTIGPGPTNLATDEFIEIYNPTNSTISLAGFRLRRSSDCGTTLSNIYTFPSGVELLPGQYYLVAGQDYSGTVFDVRMTTDMSISNTGGIAITDASNNPIDQVGMCASTTYREGTELADITTTTGESYQRNDGGALDSCRDSGNNAGDFQPISPSNPQNSSTPRRVCGGNADLSITQHTVDNPTPAVPSNVTFTITVNNSGPGDARNVEVKDVLPTGLIYDSSSATWGSYSNATSNWTVGTLASGTSATLTLVARVTTGGAKTNTAEVWNSYDQDPDSTPGNGGSTEDDIASVTVAPPSTGSADLSIIQGVNNPTPNINDSIVFSITVNNAGTDTATNIIVNDDLPAGLAYVSDNGGGAYNSTTGEWIITSLASGSSTILRITARVISAGAKTNTVFVQSAEQSDPDSTPGGGPITEDDYASVTVTPGGGVADLRLELTSAKSSPEVAGQVVLTITVTNDGPYPATNVLVMDELPEGLTYVSDNSSGAYNKTTGIWSAGAIDKNNSATLKITASVDATATTGTLENEAEIWSADQSPSDSRVYGNGSTDEDDDDSVIVEAADLSITKSMDNVTPVVGADVVFTIRVSNAGPNDAENVEVKDILPAGYQYLSHSVPAGTTYNNTTGIWDVGTIADGDSETLQITATVLSTTVSTFVNWAEVWASDQIDIDSVPGNSSRNTDDDANAPSADLRISNEVSTPYPGLDTNFRYTITVTNDGTVGATGVQVKDKLPSGVTYVSYTSTVPISGTTGVYTPSTGYWVVGTLATGASETLTITAKITASGYRTNWAEVWKSDLADPDSTPGNSSTTEDDDASSVVAFRPVLINEVAWSGTTASSSDEWLELYNVTSTEITISGWKIRKGGCSSGTDYITLNGKIAKTGFFLLERQDDRTISDISASQIYSSAELSNDGDTLYLCDGTNLIDTANVQGVGNSKNPWPKGGGTNKASMERQGNTAESDTVWVANTGVTRNGKNASGGLIYGTPGKKNSTGVQPTPTVPPPTPTRIPPAVRPIINEFLVRPGYDWNQDGKVDVFDEFIEVKNIGVVDVNMNGWLLDDEQSTGSAPFTFPNITLKPGEYAIFYGSQTNILLGDGGDTVRLINPSGKIYDAYTYEVVKAEDQSICRLPDGHGDWYEDCIPTPNRINSREGEVPTMPDGEAFESPVCNLPDTLPADFLFAECRGYGADIWRSFYWDQYGWQGDKYVPENTSKWESFVE